MEQRQTYSFSTSLLQHIQTVATMAERYAIKQGLDGFLAAWAAYDGKEKIEKVGESIVKLTDMMLLPAKKKEGVEDKITCGRGCAHCCKQAVQISPPEAAYLLQVVKEKGLVLDEQKLKLQARLDSDSQWAAQIEPVRTCVFLGENNECQVYEARPVACRKYFSLGEPDLCDIGKHPGGLVQIWFGMDAEIMSSAVITHFGADYLPRALLAEMEKQKEASSHDEL